MAATLFERQMAMYTTYHRDHRNRLTHFFGIPAIIVSLLVALALARIGLGGVSLSMGLIVGAAALSLVSPSIFRALRTLLRPWPKLWRTTLRMRRRVHRWLLDRFEKRDRML